MPAGRPKLDPNRPRICSCGVEVPKEDHRSQCRACRAEYMRLYKRRRRAEAEPLRRSPEPPMPQVADHNIRTLSHAKQDTCARVRAQLASPEIVESMSRPFYEVVKVVEWGQSHK